MLVLERLFPANPLTYASLRQNIPHIPPLCLSSFNRVSEGIVAHEGTSSSWQLFVRRTAKKGGPFAFNPRGGNVSSWPGFVFLPGVCFFFLSVRLISDPISRLSCRERERERLRAGKKVDIDDSERGMEIRFLDF